jgi:hypothetical protein
VNAEEWSSCSNPITMFDGIRGRVGERKCRLFTVACCRRADPTLSACAEARVAVETTERYVDGLASSSELEAASNAAREAVYRPFIRPASPDAGDSETSHIARIARWASETRTWAERPGEPWWYGATLIAGNESDLRRQKPNDNWRSWSSCIIRCIFGNPFRPVAFDPKWRTEDVLGLSRGIYEDRAFDRLPLLADALMDAGCDDEQVLAHCRNNGPHARGCWVVDLVLGKE